MDKSFWHQRWKNNEIAFHQRDTNPQLVNYFSELSLAKGDRVFVPLCGKTLDIAWMLSNGYHVAGAELSETAVEQLFIGLGIKPNVSEVDRLKRYREKNIDIFVGDIFDLSSKLLGPVDAIYDRAALVALPEEMRGKYTAHLMAITNNAPQLLICYEYDQRLMAGPPFSVIGEEVNRHYRGNYELRLMASASVPGGLKGKCAAAETVWLLQRR